jgi:hypothetical protein
MIRLFRFGLARLTAPDNNRLGTKEAKNHEIRISRRVESTPGQGAPIAAAKFLPFRDTPTGARM